MIRISNIPIVCIEAPREATNNQDEIYEKYPSIFHNMDNDPRIRAQAEKLAARNEDWAKKTKL